MADPKCPKCSAKMEAGFIVDHNYDSAKASQWVEGPAEASFWTGVKLRGKERRPIHSYRCVRCGFLESFAR